MARRNRDKEPVVRLSLLYHHPPLSFLVLARQAWFPTQGAARIVHPSEAASLTVPPVHIHIHVPIHLQIRPHKSHTHTNTTQP